MDRSAIAFILITFYAFIASFMGAHEPGKLSEDYLLEGGVIFIITIVAPLIFTLIAFTFQIGKPKTVYLWIYGICAFVIPAYADEFIYT